MACFFLICRRECWLNERTLKILLKIGLSTKHSKPNKELLLLQKTTCQLRPCNRHHKTGAMLRVVNCLWRANYSLKNWGWNVIKREVKNKEILCIGLSFHKKNCRYDSGIGCLMKNDDIGLNLETARMLKEMKKWEFSNNWQLIKHNMLP